MILLQCGQSLLGVLSVLESSTPNDASLKVMNQGYMRWEARPNAYRTPPNLNCFRHPTYAALLPRSESQLAFLDSRNQAKHNQYACHNDSPQPDM